MRAQAKHYVYRNLHRQCWSVRLRGKVIDHVDSIILMRARFQVGEAGRQRVLREQRKNVHAFVVGDPITDQQAKQCAREFAEAGRPINHLGVQGWKVKYNPYKAADFFVDPAWALGDPDGWPGYPPTCGWAYYVELTADGEVYAYQPTFPHWDERDLKDAFGWPRR